MEAVRCGLRADFYLTANGGSGLPYLQERNDSATVTLPSDGFHSSAELQRGSTAGKSMSKGRNAFGPTTRAVVPITRDTHRFGHERIVHLALGNLRIVRQKVTGICLRSRFLCYIRSVSAACLADNMHSLAPGSFTYELMVIIYSDASGTLPVSTSGNN